VLSELKKRTKEAFYSELGKPAVGTSAKVCFSVSFSLLVIFVDNLKHCFKLWFELELICPMCLLNFIEEYVPIALNKKNQNV
jgi:hypothetical protein